MRLFPGQDKPCLQHYIALRAGDSSANYIAAVEREGRAGSWAMMGLLPSDGLGQFIATGPREPVRTGKCGGNRHLLRPAGQGARCALGLRASNRVGVTRGTLEARRDPLAIIGSGPGCHVSSPWPSTNRRDAGGWRTLPKRVTAAAGAFARLEAYATGVRRFLPSPEPVPQHRSKDGVRSRGQAETSAAARCAQKITRSCVWIAVPV